ncbi:DUF1802 family protein [Altericista sp. CCNU0014]|uniref:DUF1802 family protein n=1 Tax=Altericista sp. CCNU0014 TaxID=3082949 RepID=UPI0038506F87
MANAAEGFGRSRGQDNFLDRALKEWAIAISALRSGEMVLLLRKGGIRDPIRPFATLPQRAALFPTYEHQVARHLKQPDRLVPPDAAPTLQPTLQIDTWARITHGFELGAEVEIAALMPFHIWTVDFVIERLKWRSSQPIQALLLRTYRLPAAIDLERSPLQAGCRSWIDLKPAISTQHSIAALSDPEYRVRLEAIERAMQAVKGDFKLESCKLP